MDIMRPKLTRIRNMFFRRLDIPNDGIVDDLNDQNFYKQMIENIVVVENEDKKVETETNLPKLKSVNALEESHYSEDIEDISGGKGNRFRAQLEIGKYFHKFIVGANGRQKLDIEFHSKCRLQIPAQTDLTGAIVITGDCEADVKSAVDNIRSIVKRARDRSDFTHFLSIPFNDYSICDRFLAFKTQILNNNEINKGIDESLFQSKNKLHLTIAILLLTDQTDRNIASDILDDCHNNYIKPLISGQSLKIKLEGVDYMNDDPTQVNVLFAKVHDMTENQCLQSIVDHLYEKFAESGLMPRQSQTYIVNDERKVKLHVTLMNTSFKQKRDRPQSRGRDRDRPKREYFNASGIVNKFKDYYFGEITAETIEISIRSSNRGRNGYYSHTSRIDL